MCECEVGCLCFGQFGQEVVVVLGDFSILASNQTLEFSETFEPLFEGALLVFWSATVFSVDVFGFVQVKLWKAFCAHINSLPVGLVPSGPRA